MAAQRVSDAFDDDDLQFACAVLLAVRGGLKVLGLFVAGDRLLEARKLDDDEAVEFLRAFEDLELAAPRQELAVEFLSDGVGSNASPARLARWVAPLPPSAVL